MKIRPTNLGEIKQAHQRMQKRLMAQVEARRKLLEAEETRKRLEAEENKFNSYIKTQAREILSGYRYGKVDLRVLPEGSEDGAITRKIQEYNSELDSGIRAPWSNI